MNPVLESSQFISQHSKHVFIGSKIESAAKELLKMREQGEFKLSNWKEDPLNPKEASEATLKWIFVIDLLNFSFWANTPEELCVIKWKEGKYTGYWSLCAAINRAIEEGIQITDPNYMKSITIEQLNHIFRSENSHSIPLLSLRQQVLQEAGKVIIENFDGDICNIVKRANNSALKLVEILVDNFSSFRDQSTFLDRIVYFRKRAQIFVADVWACFEGESYGKFADIDQITMFADYRVPQALVYLGALEYSSELSNTLNSTLLQPNDPLEIEIRGNSIWSVELILNAMKEISSRSPGNNSDPLNSISIDFFLWKYAKEKSNDPLMKSIPIHKIRTVFY